MGLPQADIGARQNGLVAVLSRSEQNPSMLTVQCDVCCPPPIATNDERVLRAAGWRFGGEDDRPDLCPATHGRGARPRAEPGPTSGAAPSMLPNLMIIGAAKCGTTSLHAYLDSHPQVFMARLKELRFFSDPECRKWLPWYCEQFPTDAPVRGESSTMYTRAPALPGTAERMHSLLPDAKLIYMVRDPVERAVASYLEERFQRLDPRPLAEAFADLDDPYNPYVAASRYAEQLGHFRKHFADEQILVLPLGELERQPEATMARVFAFVGVDDTNQVDIKVRLNEGVAKYEYPGVGGRLRRSALGSAVRRLPPRLRTPVQARARRLLGRPLARPELSEELRDRLREALAPDTVRLREVTGLDLADWSV